jgi:hypothetical protein
MEILDHRGDERTRRDDTYYDFINVQYIICISCISSRFDGGIVECDLALLLQIDV